MYRVFLIKTNIEYSDQKSIDLKFKCLVAHIIPPYNYGNVEKILR